MNGLKPLPIIDFSIQEDGCWFHVKCITDRAYKFASELAMDEDGVVTFHKAGFVHWFIKLKRENFAYKLHR
jgi:hypothetical protein